ncbi:MAG TPA: BTAD domain-containing putative transcriptional regulator [Streptosporangiaceae bacterium]|nr:BTAD domain-containing putative transcriptional regulator [Streptosporangiaceae bacterium]
MIYRLLGELQIGTGGLLVDLPGGPTLIVLASLLVNANRRVAKAELIRAAWDSEDMAEAQLHKRVNQVRKLLDQIGRRDDLHTHSGFGYEMRVAENDVDSLRFQRLVREADEAGTNGRAAEEIGQLRQALQLWRGPKPLSNVPGDAFRQDSLALVQRRKRAAVRLFELELERGNHEAILDELMSVAGFYPSDQRLAEQLMTAAYRCGHVTDATAAFDRYREALEEETGGEPDPLLRGLYFAIGSGDEEAIAAAESAIAKRSGTVTRSGTPARPVVAVPRQLPRPADLVGREDMTAEVSWLLRRKSGATAPVLVISGSGGIGKTALALRAAHDASSHYPDGQLYMELRGTVGGAADTGEVVAQFLRAFGVPRVPDTTAERLAAYRTLLAERRVLIVLDDAVDEAQVADLVPANPGCAVLVTARQRLPQISGVHHVAPLEPLRRAEATELFLRVVRDAGIALEKDLDAVDRVVTLCGGLPLALRIAGALRVHDHPRSTAQLVQRLAQYGPEGFVYGQLNVARTIGAGLDRLDGGARQLFLGLGLLPLTSFGLWTAAALLDDTSVDPGMALSQLTASFMLESVESEQRYRFHDLTRDYVRRRGLAEYPADSGAAAARAYQALLTLARRAHAGLLGGDYEVVHSQEPAWEAPAEVLAEVDESPGGWFEKERASIRAAVEDCAKLGLTALCWDLAVSAHEFYTVHGYHDDWHATHTVALEACRRSGDRRGEGIVLACFNQPALPASMRGGGGSDLANLERAAGLLAECGDRHGQAIALRTLANALRRHGYLTRALALFDEALGYYTASADPVGRSQTLRFIGQTRLDLGRHDEASQALEEAATVASELGSNRLIAQARYWIGQACLLRGDIDGAQVAFDAVFDVYGDTSGGGYIYALHGLGQVAAHRGAYSIAGRHLSEAASLAHDIASAPLEGRIWLSIAELRHAQGQPGEQAEALRAAVTVLHDGGEASLEAQALAELARVLTERGDTAAAGQVWTRIENLYAADLPEEDRIYRRPDGG